MPPIYHDNSYTPLYYGVPSTSGKPTPADIPDGGEGDLPPQNDGDDAADDAADDGMAVLEVEVPENARVFVNGKATTSSGVHRRYVSRGLQSGFSYTYEVRVEGEVDGEMVSETKTVQITAGQESKLAFELKTDFETVLTLNVPKDAEVYLGGNRTKATGNVRVYRTKSLKQGDAWRDYEIRVVLNSDGEPQVREQTITMNAGEKKSMTFDFTQTVDVKVAASR